jgi:hypothetical protein
MVAEDPRRIVEQHEAIVRPENQYVFKTRQRRELAADLEKLRQGILRPVVSTQGRKK